ncbi:EpsI family protein [Geomonas terrae]|uniref:EpsI family protein n=1 Tax=Geomonas terrae TaxID=2562681 RepID=A0A4S1CH31_9BACT|nr:exosortase C-terminal domain/associated protein EpsI [Geomonas terrae]TGU70461.1 EpsI family protein [Geomonas terrae]TGU72881.1 EpsI family protein [Geomonas terrae]
MRNASFVTALILLVLTGAVSSLLAYRPVPVVVATNLEKLPMEIDGYHAVEDTFPESVYKELNADKNIYRHYRSADGRVIDLYIGYYGTAKGGRTGHNPYSCLPSAGSAIVETGTIDCTMSTGKTARVNVIVARKDELNTVLLHWYQTGGTTVASSSLYQNLGRLVNRVMHNKDDGAYIQISQAAADGNVAQAKQHVRVFAGKLLDSLPAAWPVER